MRDGRLNEPTVAGTDPDSPILGVIIPAFNEERSLELVVRRVLQEPSVQQVVIVDDCSTDGTLAAARRCGGDSRVTVKNHATNQGKGAAIRTGLAAITAPLVIIQAPDLPSDPPASRNFIPPILPRPPHALS